MSLFESIKSQLSILDVVSDYVTLKRIGTYYKGPCPFHAEKDASFTVSPDKQIFYCFGCHAGGDAIAFVAQAENFSQLQALRFVAERYQIPLGQEALQELQTSSAATPATQRQRHYIACKGIARWCHEQLRLNDAAQIYLQQRGLKRATIDLFEIGYFPGGQAAINDFLKAANRLSILLSDLTELGFIAEARSGLYTPFEERIIFPIKDQLGRNVGFGGRIFKPNDTRPKYYNSSESDVFSKRTLLYGLDTAKKTMQQTEKAFLVEGYMDCLTMAQHGFPQTVATLGTACSVEHLRTLARFVNTVYVSYDGDDAGQKAILRLTEQCWEVNLELRVIALPPGEDPAALLSRGESLTPLVETSHDIFDFFVLSASAHFEQKSLAEKMAASTKILGLINTVKDPFKRELLVQQTASRLGVTVAAINRQRHAPRARAPQSEEPLGNVSLKDPAIRLEEMIVSGILGGIGSKQAAVCQAIIPYLSQPLQKIIHDHAALRQQMPSASSAEIAHTLLDKMPVEDRTAATRLFMEENYPPEGDWQSMVNRFVRTHWRRIVRDLKRDITTAREHSDAEKIQELMGVFLRFSHEVKSKGLV